MMLVKNAKETFVLLLSELRHGAERTSKFFDEISQKAYDEDVKEALEARVFVSQKILSTIDECFKLIGEQPVKTGGRLYDVFAEDFRKELAEIPDQSARLLFILARASQVVHLRIAEYKALIAAADLAGHFSVGVLLESCLADNLAFVDRTKRLIRAIAETRVGKKPPTASQTADFSIVRQEQVRGRAYEIYEQRRREDGHDIDDWLQAESEMILQPKKRRTMAGTFDLKQAGNGQFMFNLKAGNGEVILTSELYRQKQSAIIGIDSVKANAGDDNRYERKTAKNGQPFFVLTATNSEIIGKSEMYSSASAMENGIQSVKNNGPVAAIEDSTDELRSSAA